MKYRCVRLWLSCSAVGTVVFIENLILCTHLYKIVGLINTISLSIYVSQELSLSNLILEFDSGSGRTLAACLIHASRTDIIAI